jgi:ribonuclease HI
MTTDENHSINILKSIIVFTDGACSGNPGPGGWGAVIAFPEGYIKELGGAADATTNNEMEMLALDKAFSYLNHHDKDRSLHLTNGRHQNMGTDLHIFSDSTYVIRGLTQWVWGWKNKGWKTAQGEDVKNKDLWQKLMRNLDIMKKTRKVFFHYSRGHVGTPGNERCDEIAVGMSQKKWVSLYEGDLLNYSISIYDLPTDTELPPMKDFGAEKKKEVFCYLSLVDGKAMKHATWSECEARVKGRSGAKFKKCSSEQEMQDLLSTWGARLN